MIVRRRLLADTDTDGLICETGLASIRKLFEQEFAAANAGDIDALLNLRTIDATEIMPGELPLIGQAAIRDAWSLQADASERFRLTSIQQIQLGGDLASVFFFFEHSTTPLPGGESIVGDYQVLWLIQREPGQDWKIHLEMVSPGAGDQ